MKEGVMISTFCVYHAIPFSPATGAPQTVGESCRDVASHMITILYDIVYLGMTNGLRHSHGGKDVGVAGLISCKLS